MDHYQYLDPSKQLQSHIKAGLICTLCTGGLLTPAQRDELLQRQRMVEK